MSIKVSGDFIFESITRRLPRIKKNSFVYFWVNKQKHYGFIKEKSKKAACGVHFWQIEILGTDRLETVHEFDIIPINL